MLYALHQIMPAEVSLLSLDYDEDSQVTLRGQAPELNSVFALVGKLEESEVFKNFNVKVRYATKKKIQESEIIDFEIACSKK